MERGKEITAVQKEPTASRWLMIFLFLTGALASTISLKLARIQYLEILYFIELGVLLIAFSRNNYKVTWFRPYHRIACQYIIFSSAAVLLAIYALRYDFYFPPGLGFLYRPLVITVSRISELVASVAITLLLAHKFREDPRSVAFIMRVYFWTGVLSALYSLVSYPLDIAGVSTELGAYGDTHRMRGFYNEGGPYGLYLLSVFLVGISLHKQGWIKKRNFQLSFAVISIAFLGSRSKAAFCALILVLLLNGVFAKSFIKRIILVVSIAVALTCIYQVVDLGAALRAYRRGSQAYEWLSHQHMNDPNFVDGRIAGAFIVPRMIDEHPLAGVGWGNYGLVRNAPEYRGAAAFTRENDDPGLGIIGMAAELGLPLTLYLGVCLILPFLLLRRIKSPSHITNLALLQPIVHLFGGQLNLTYPWIVTSFALGLGYSVVKALDSQNMPIRVA